MICPYPGCGGDVPQAQSPSTYCPKCAQPVFLCSECQAANRTLARFCRICKIPGRFPVTKISQSSKSAAVNLAQQPISLKPIDQKFWITPVVYRGLLWCLSMDGVVWKVSPFSSCATHFAILSEDNFGQAPFIIREVAIGRDPYDLIPCLLAASPTSVKAVNLLTGEVKQIFSVSPNERIISSIAQSYSMLEADERTVYFLQTSDGKPVLNACNIADSSITGFEFQESSLAGPFKMGSLIGVYSSKALYLLDNAHLDNAHLQRFPFPDDYTAWVKPGEIAGIQPPSGRMPFIVNANSIYIPGIKNGDSGFLYYSLQGNLARAFIPVKEEASYNQDIDGRLLIAGKGRITLLDGPSKSDVKKDGEFIARGPSYYNEPLVIGFASTAGRVQSLRFYYDEKMIDHPLGKFYGFEESFGFFNVAGALVFAYLDNSNYMVMKVWLP